MPDTVTAAFFLSVWIAPMALGRDAVRVASMVILLEFFLVHASGALYWLAFDVQRSTASKVVAMLATACGYLLLVGGLGALYGSWLPVVAFGWLVLGKLFIVLDQSRHRDDPSDRASQSIRAMNSWLLSLWAYVIGAHLTLLPFPRLGMTRDLVAEFDLPGSGHWADHPHTFVAWGALYFGFLAVSKFYDWARPGGE